MPPMLRPVHAVRCVPQYRHYQALLDIFKLRPAKEGREFGELVMFMGQVRQAGGGGAGRGGGHMVG